MVETTFWERVEKRQWTIFTIFIAILATVVPIVSWKNAQTSIEKTHQLTTGNLNPISLPSSFEGVVVMANVTSVQPLQYTCTVRYLFIPVGRFAANSSAGADYRFSRSFLFMTGDFKMEIDPLQPMPTALVSYGFLEGSPIRYPFDQYPADFTLSIYDLANNSVSVPVALGLIPAKQSWSADAYISELDSEDLQITITFYRSWMTKLFACYVFLTLWVLALLVIKMAWDIWWEERVIAESATLRLAIRFLVAFPALRFTQPGLPVLGCTEDTASFFWCMGIAAIATIVLMVNYMESNIFRDNAKSQPIGKWAPLIEFYDSDEDEVTKK